MPIVLDLIPIRETTIDFGEAGTLTLRYRPPSGADVARTLAAAQNPDEQPAQAFDALVDLIVNRVVDWDVVDGSGKKMPVSRETLLLLPADWIVQIANAMQGGLREGE
jgi:hypothetical protein